MPARLRGCVLAGPLSAAIAAGVLLCMYPLAAAWTVDLASDLPPLARGFYPPEAAPDGVTFAWTAPTAAIAFDGLDRRVEWTLALRVIVWRPPRVPLPEVHLTVDGVTRQIRKVSRDFEELEIVLPKRPGNRGAVVGIAVVPGFRPDSPSDTRELGIAVDRLALSPKGRLVVPPIPTLGGLALSAALLGTAFSLCGASPAVVATSMVPLGAAQSWLATRRFAPYLSYASQAVWLAAGIAAGFILIVCGIDRRRRRRLDPAERFIAFFSASALYLRMLVLLHPDMPIGDALFHAHRLEYVLQGRFFFASLAPGDYAFPYPIALYLVAAPFSVLTANSADRIVLLRTIVTTADVLAGVAVYAMVVRAWGDRLAGAVALATYHLLPLGARIMEWGNLTNAFGQTLFVVTIAALASPKLRLEAPRRVVALAALMTATFLAHVSTFGILAGLAAFAWGLLRFSPEADEAARSAGQAVLVAALGAGAFAVGVYYAHFLGTYRLTVGRLASELAATAAAPRWGSLVDRTLAVPARIVQHYGWPAVLLAAFGVWRLRFLRPADRLRPVLAAWAASCLLFLAVGLLTPVDLRYYLAALPAVAMLSGLAWSAGWRTGWRWRPALIAASAWAVWIGLHTWVAPLR